MSYLCTYVQISIKHGYFKQTEEFEQDSQKLTREQIQNYPKEKLMEDIPLKWS